MAVSFQVISGDTNETIEHQVEDFKLYRDAKARFEALDGKARVCYRLETKRGELVERIAKLYQFEKGRDNSEFLTKYVVFANKL
ncbi:hypothetical protein [Pseudoalteromonas sp. Of7M-16]|uniref:hypothetical protein n=1 Tax=Pseudoalteromonas sp. Of7M-16 TaxID=2917756 RepID=UPI001EF44363|nr:hypothetical protein [Pseudoalteromonas sp. Of7M-16]MCG7550891.1 hypothetical protein [Pseudoalteromonas sp. Of7M-16]